MSDLAKIGDLLSLHCAGVLEVSHIGGSAWLRARKAARLLPPLESLTWEREPSINAVPLKQAGHYLGRVPSSVIWVRTGSGKAAEKLRTFKPLPDVVIREGSTVRYVAFWALSEPLDANWTERATRRLAKHFNAGQYADAAIDFRFYLPGTILRADRRRPMPVELVRFEPAVHRAFDIVGKLKDPPTDEERRELAERAKARRDAAKAEQTSL